MTRTAVWISVAVVLLAGCEGDAPKSSNDTAPKVGGAAPTATKPAVAPEKPASQAPSASVPPASPAPAPAGAPGPMVEFPQPDVSKLPMPMQMRIGSARQAARNEPGQVARTIELAALFYAQGFFQEAATTMRHASTMAPDDFAVWYMTGRALDKAGDARGAAEMYEKAFTVQSAYFDAHPDEKRIPYLPILIRLAGVSFDVNPARATEVLNQAREIDPNDPTVYSGLATIAQKAGRHDEAIEKFRKALDLSPAYGYAHAGLAASYEAKGDADRAALHRAQTTATDPYVPVSDPVEMVTLQRGMQVDVLLLQANELIRRRDFVQAEQAIQSAIDADGSGIRGRTMLGVLRTYQGRHEEAVREYRSVLRADPNSVPTRMALADALASVQNHTEAEQLLREVIAGNPKLTVAIDQLARMLASQKRADEAAKLVVESVAKFEEDGRLMTEAAETLARIDRLSEARVMAERAVKAAPHLAEARNVYGYLLLRGGDQAGAMREWREAIKIAPQYAAPRIQLVQALYAKRDRTGMSKELREGVEANPYSVDMLNSLAWLLATAPEDSLRNAAEAVLYAERADMLTNSVHHAVLDTLAAAYAEAGRFSEAQARAAAAITLAREAGLKREVEDYQKRLDLYKSNQPYRDQ